MEAKPMWGLAAALLVYVVFVMLVSRAVSKLDRDRE